MKIIIMKYTLVGLVMSLSAYSYLFLNNQSEVLTENLKVQQSEKRKGKKVLIHNPNNNTTKLVIIAPPSKEILEENERKNKDYDETPSAEDKNMLPDVEFLKFVIQKSKEGIPVLHFKDFLRF